VFVRSARRRPRLDAKIQPGTAESALVEAARGATARLVRFARGRRPVEVERLDASDVDVAGGSTTRAAAEDALFGNTCSWQMLMASTSGRILRCDTARGS